MRPAREACGCRCSISRGMPQAYQGWAPAGDRSPHTLDVHTAPHAVFSAPAGKPGAECPQFESTKGSQVLGPQACDLPTPAFSVDSAAHATEIGRASCRERA